MRVVERQRRTAGSRHAVVLQQGMRTVLAGTYGHTFQIQQGSQIVRMGAVDKE
ncbi:hypothetical protein D3C71_2154740 [compost metagenome]